ncbi:MAG: leucyl/phenylalanyl-tRNA--protein transferase [Ilumatobacteraceae bacterium]
MRPPDECRWGFPPPDEWPADDDVVAVGADLDPDTLLWAYAHGMFPMRLGGRHPRLGWWSPVRRGIIPLESLRISRSLAQSTRKFEFTVNAAFSDVMEACASDRTDGNWIDDDFLAAYLKLHRLGSAHSIEVWDAEGRLAGGLYGVRIGGFFAGESMFHRVRDASKVALVRLVDLMRLDGMGLLDTQWCTPHLASLGCIEVTRSEYLRRLAAALADPHQQSRGQ